MGSGYVVAGTIDQDTKNDEISNSKNECPQLMIDTINDKLDAALPETGNRKPETGNRKPEIAKRVRRVSECRLWNADCDRPVGTN